MRSHPTSVLLLALAIALPGGGLRPSSPFSRGATRASPWEGMSGPLPSSMTRDTTSRMSKTGSPVSTERWCG